MSNKRNFFRTALDAMIEARQREANRYVNSALLMLDDTTLAKGGYDRKTLERKGPAGYIL